MRVSLWVPCWTNYQTYQGNPCGIYPDLSSFTGSGVYPDLSSFTGSGVYPGLSSFTGSGVVQKLYNLYQAIRPVRFTSSGIRASALDTGSILSYCFLCNLSRFVFCPCAEFYFLLFLCLTHLFMSVWNFFSLFFDLSKILNVN